MPVSSGFPKQQFLKYIDEMRKRQAQQTQTSEVDDMIALNTPDVDELLMGLSEEQRQQALQNPEMLQDIIAQKMGLS